jgi:C4-dicarboxylate-specific signal transduction histidine kinase
MPTFTLLQAREGRNAVRMVSVRAAVPFIGTLSATDVLTFSSIVSVIVIICMLVYRETRSARQMESGVTSLEEERNRLSEKVSERTRELVDTKAKQLEELNRTAQLGEISRGLFHDLMGPLAAVSMYLDKLGSSNTQSASAQDVVKKVVSISKRMNEYMESVRRCIGTVASPAELRSSLQKEIAIIKDILGYKARMAGVSLNSFIDGDIELALHPMRLHQLLYNLTNNAIDACNEQIYSTGDGGVVTIDAQKADSIIHIRIRDNGCGMPAEDIEGIFHHSKTTKQKGLGIGLKTVKTIIDELHGNIQIESRLDQGTEFHLVIPA